jgi:hypothetical protein
MCIPYNSFHEGTDDACEAPVITQRYENPLTGQEIRYLGGAFTAGEGPYDALATEYEDCTYYGASAQENELGITGFDKEGDTNGDSYDGKDHDYSVEPTSGFAVSTYAACQSILQLSSGNISEYNVAYTDRLLNFNRTFVLDAGEFTHERDTVNGSFGTSLSPFGVNTNYHGVLDPTPRVVPSCNNDTAESTGIPLDLNGNCPAATYTNKSFGNDNGAATEALGFIEWSAGSFSNGNLTTSDDLGDVHNRLSLLYAVPLKIFEWLSEGPPTEDANFEGLGLYDDGFNPTGDLEWDDRAENGNPPEVFSIDPRHCYGTKCREGSKDQITVNNQNVGDINGSEGFIRATVKFYAAADKEQLPIRRVIVDWGDGSNMSGSPDAENFYKNHRGLEATSNSESICDSDAEWGMTSDSCDDNFFNYSHNYFCSKTDLIDMPNCDDDDGDGNVDVSPCKSNNVDGVESCTFRPAVHIRDNWGWCAGVCNIDPLFDDDGSDGCFEGDEIDTLNNASDEESECSYLEFPRFGGDSVDPWVYYNGNVYVEPS